MAKNNHKLEPSVQTLMELGLSENEAVLYMLMLGLPRSTVRELNAHTPFPRTMLYYVLKQLIERGIVSENNSSSRTTYLAEDPEHLYELLAAKERKFELDNNNIRELIPRLKHRYRLAGTRPSVRVFEGIDEYQKALEDILISNPSEILTFESLGKRKPAIESRDTYDAKRISKKILKKVLFFETERARQALKRRKYDDFTRFRRLNKSSVLPFEADFSIYDGKILYTSYSDEFELTAVLIEDHALYLMQKNLFDSLWQEATDRTLLFTEK